MKRFFKNVVLMLLPFAAAMCVELFVLPIDQFCLRSSEAIIVFALWHQLPGPFYPNQRLERDEVGNLGAHTPYAVSRHCLWITDRYGFRYDDSAYPGDAFDIVVVGDSQVEGDGLTQVDILSSVLSKDLGRKVYPYASYALNDFLHDPRFQRNPPKVVIYAKTEFALPSTPALENTPFDRSPAYTSRFRQNAVVLSDRALKSTLLNSCKARGRSALKIAGNWLRRKSGKPAYDLGSYVTLGTDGKMLFRSSDLDLKPLSDADIDQVAQRLDAYRGALEKRGISFIFLPIPDKSSVYYERVRWQRPPNFLPRLNQAVQRYRLDAVDTLDAYLHVRDSPGTPPLYQWDDTHWSAEGVRMAAQLLENKLKKTRF